MKLLIAALLSAALIWLVPSASAQNINNSEAKVAVAKKAQTVTSSQKAEPKAAPAQVAEAPAPAPPAPQPTQPAPAPVEPAQPSSHAELMAAAGIVPSDYGAVEYIVQHESGWNPNATEPTSGAHGLPQILPYSKSGCGWVDAVCQLQWANSYAVARYGGWWSAQAYWSVHRNW